MTSPKFALTISLNVLEHLGINLYSNVPSVLSEIVANAWDADAALVRVQWDRGNSRIVIADDGTGMTVEEVNARFLKVGHRRRDDQPGPTAKGRLPMGRKGIGKLSLFSIAGTVVVETAKNGTNSAFRMCLDDIRTIVRNAGGAGTYQPEEIDTSSIDFDHGTRITLTNLKKRQTAATSAAVRKRVARRFGILGGQHGFSVEIDGLPVTIADRGYYDKIQFLWTYGDQSAILEDAVNVQNTEERQIPASLAGLRLSGWLGTVKESKQLKDEEGENLNRIAIFVRGKLAQEDMLSDFSERGVYASYLIGELTVDGLDTYDGPGTNQDDDAATSSRQKLVEDDPRYQDLTEFLGGELKHIQNSWQDLRMEDGAKRALEIPEVNEWMNGLKAPVRAKARRWLGKLNRIKMDDSGEQKQLIKHAILGFEFYRLHENLEQLDDISDESLPDVLFIFQELDNLEANLYGQIVQQRIKVIQTLKEKVDANALERAIQEYLFDHLWLLDPSWERAEGTELMEARVDKLVADVTESLTPEEKASRLDIKYRKAAGEHIIIELKRPERVITLSDMIDQGGKYLSGMLKILEAQGTPHEPIELVFVLGKPPKDWETPGGKERIERALEAYKARVVFYDGLLANAEKSYQDYLKQRKVVDTLAGVINAIDNYAPSALENTG